MGPGDARPLTSKSMKSMLLDLRGPGARAADVKINKSMLLALRGPGARAR
jgi:hypothetical protein